MTKKTVDIYNNSATDWVRSKPITLSDFTGRPALFDACGDVSGAIVADLGCGEGYCARQMLKNGAKQVDGIDISKRMIHAAQSMKGASENMNFDVGDITSLPMQSSFYDLAVGVFVFNYLSIEETFQSFAEVFRVLKPRGQFVFCVPHPSFPFIWTGNTKPFYFSFEKGGYFSNRNNKTSGEIWRIDNKKLHVEMCHKLLSDYFDALQNAGFNTMPVIKELGVDQWMIDEHPSFFEPIKDIPLHLLISIKK